MASHRAALKQTSRICSGALLHCSERYICNLATFGIWLCQRIDFFVAKCVLWRGRTGVKAMGVEGVAWVIIALVFLSISTSPLLCCAQAWISRLHWCFASVFHCGGRRHIHFFLLNMTLLTHKTWMGLHFHSLETRLFIFRLKKSFLGEKKMVWFVKKETCEGRFTPIIYATYTSK